jgi:hypothetical protein
MTGQCLAEDAQHQITFDKNKFLKDFEELQKKADTPATAGLLPKHRYCVVCNGTLRLNCDVPAGGEVGRAMCGAYGIAQCGGGQVNYNGC